jgi:hypothetical protein
VPIEKLYTPATWSDAAAGWWIMSSQGPRHSQFLLAGHRILT